MDVCTYSGRENIGNASSCPQCGKAEFKTITPPQTSGVPISKPKRELEFVPLNPNEAESDFVTLLRCRTLLEADLIVSRLESTGIQAFIPDQFLMQTISWNVNTYGFVRVQVPPSVYSAAKELLSANE